MTSTEQREESVVELLTAEVRQAREDYGRAMNELGRLQAQLGATKAAPDQVEPPPADCAGERARAEQLEAENANLRHWLTWRTIALEILLLGVAGISAVIWITQWWPWE